MESFTKTRSPRQYDGFYTSIYDSDFDNYEGIIIVVDDKLGSKQNSFDPFLQGVVIKI